MAGGSSDSEFSDAPDAQFRGRRASSGRVRHAALSCTQVVIRCAAKKAIYRYWQSFIPTATDVSAPVSLFAVMAQDPAPKTRTAAIGVLMALLEGSRQFLSSADDSEKAASFKSFASTVGSMVSATHSQLLLMVEHEKSPMPLAAALKCLGILLANTPYNRLKKGYMARIAEGLNTLVAHKGRPARLGRSPCRSACRGSCPTDTCPRPGVFPTQIPSSSLPSCPVSGRCSPQP